MILQQSFEFQLVTVNSQGEIIQRTRQEILQEYFQLEQNRECFEIEHFKPGGKGYEQEHKKYLEWGKRQKDLGKEYQSGLPIIPLSRCPFCQTIISHSLDTFGLDGLWWEWKGCYCCRNQRYKAEHSYARVA